MAAVVRQCLRFMNSVSPGRGLASKYTSILATTQPCHPLHTTSNLQAKKYFKLEPPEPKNWPKYNEIIYPPTKPGEPIRPAEIVHHRSNIKYSYKKLWYLASMIRGMSIDEAMKQMSFHWRKGSRVVKEVLEEAQDAAIKDHNVEYKSNLWVEDAFVGKGMVVKGYRKHRGPRYGIIHYRYTHLFVRLREGKPPEHYYQPPKTGWELMQEYLREQRARTVKFSL